MKAVISSTYDNRYLYFIPICVWAWNKLGVDVICFVPSGKEAIKKGGSILQGVYSGGNKKMYLINETIDKNSGKISIHSFNCPEHKEATYAQCLRNYAACLDLPEDELLVTSDVDMSLFKIPEYIDNKQFSVFGYDLVPQGQYPQCYVTAPVKAWREAFNLNGKTYQQAIDELLGYDECQDYRGCRWSVDQEQSFLNISKTEPNLIPRTNGQNQFAQNRVDRDDTNWRSYVNKDLVDAHLWRDGFTDENFANIMELMTTMYPQDDFTWLIDYNNAYKQLL